MKSLLFAVLFIPSIALGQVKDRAEAIENEFESRLALEQAIALSKSSPQGRTTSPKINFELLDFNVTAVEANEYVRRSREAMLDGKLQPLAPQDSPKRVFDSKEKAKQKLNEKAFSVGTGTRGGGSGVATTRANRLEVLVLDIYRSLHRDHSPMFSPIDDEFLAFDKNADPELESERLLGAVLSRLDKSVPLLVQAIRKAQTEMPFKSWVASEAELPLIDDYIGTLRLNNDQKQVQIAYRRGNRIIYVRSLYEEMDALNRAALKLHEYVYAISGNEQSVQIQRFVSLAMSEMSRAATFSKDAITLLAQLSLEQLARPAMRLPKTAKLGYAKLSSDDVCGKVQALDLNPADKSADITILYDPDKPHFTRKDLDSHRKSDPGRAYLQILALRKPARVHLDTAQLIEFFGAFYAAKGQLQIKYPIYLYPGQGWPADLVCLNERKNKVLQIEGSLEFHRKIRDQDLELARLETEYFRLHAELQRSSSRMREYYELEGELSLLKFKQQLLTSAPYILLWPDSETLETITVSFD